MLHTAALEIQSPPAILKVTQSNTTQVNTVIKMCQEICIRYMSQATNWAITTLFITMA